ncbi:hypothetical protein HYS91_03400 [Candidatus Daviesbacteria bacterium]|nr:hypothetical protein [Candidatus Daviesbacteria bacterium]
MGNLKKQVALLVFTLFFFFSSSVAPVLAVVTYLYDANGNLTSDGTKCYEYNEANQLKKVKNCSNNQTIAEYVYDYEGTRLVKKEFKDGALQKTIYSPSDDYETAKPVSGPNQNTTYYFANDELLAKKNPDGTKNFYHNDHLGSTNILTSESGALVEETKYDPWGELLEGGVKSKFLYTGQEKDLETGLNYYNARYYNSHIRRFTQPDDIIQNIYDPQSLNRYSYVNNNPIKYTDPSGHILGLVLRLATFIARAAPFVSLANKVMANPNTQKTIQSINKVQSKPVVINIENNSGKTVNNSALDKVISNVGNAAAQVPKVTNQKLNNYVDQFYKGVSNPNRIGSGTTADAIRFENNTGLEVFGSRHIQKGEDLIRGINKWLNANPNASEEDIKIAKTIKDDLVNALRGK